VAGLVPACQARAGRVASAACTSCKPFASHADACCGSLRPTATIKQLSTHSARGAGDSAARAERRPRAARTRPGPSGGTSFALTSSDGRERGRDLRRERIPRQEVVQMSLDHDKQSESLCADGQSGVRLERRHIVLSGVLFACVLGLLLALAGCPEGRAEKAGRQVDDTIEDVQDTAEDVIDSAEDVVDDVETADSP
jgi:hypothetical protein